MEKPEGNVTKMDSLIAEAEKLGIKPSKVKLTTFKGRDDPGKLDKEGRRHEKLVTTRLENRIARAKAKAEMKPIDRRKALLIARFKNVKSETRSAAYSDKNLKAWIEELEMINKSPKAWNKITANGTKSYVPGNKKQQSAKDVLNAMNLD